MTTGNYKTISQNKKAYFDFDITSTLETGIVLTGKEIKFIRDRKVNIAGSFVKFMNPQNPELFWINGHIGEENNERSRKLLAHKKEIDSLIGKTQQKGMTLVPIKLYLKNGKAKLEIGIGKGKKKHDKRQQIKQKDREREIRRSLS